MSRPSLTWRPSLIWQVLELLVLLAASWDEAVQLEAAVA